MLSTGELGYEPHDPASGRAPGPHGMYRIGTAQFSLDLPRWTVFALRAHPLALTLDARGVRLTVTTLQPQEQPPFS